MRLPIKISFPAESFRSGFVGLLLPVAIATAAEPAVPVASTGEKLRELNTDRPDVTESPFTVDAGHTQLEMDFASLTRHHLDGDRTTELSLGDLNLRFGVTRDLEWGLFFTPYLHRTIQRRSAGRETMSGLGDTTLRLKANFWGNDGGANAFGLILDLLLPTAARDLGERHAEPALTLPIAFDLGGGWSAGAMTSPVMRYRDDNSAHLVWLNSVTVDRELTRKIGAYAELTSTTGDGAHVATFDVGVTCKLDDDTQLDAGANIGVTREADDLVAFTGISRRF